MTTAVDQTERELKFGVGPEFELPDLSGVVGRSVRKPERLLRTTYFDTPDFRLWKRGITLRHRTTTESTTGEWTVKLPHRSDGPTLDREEISWATDGAQVPDEAMAVLAGLIRRSVLGPLVEMKTTRIPFVLYDAADHPWAELDHDEVSVIGGTRDGLRYREVEVELSGSIPGKKSLADVQKALAAAGARPDDRPKLAKALSLDQPTEMDDLRVDLGPTSTMAEVVRSALGRGLGRLLDHEYWLRLKPTDPPPHDIHQARVVTRRLRSDLSTLRDSLDPVWLGHTTGELTWLGGVLGEVRDLDVMADSLAGDERLTVVRKIAADQREGALARLNEALRSERYIDLLDRLHAASARPPLYGPTDWTRSPAAKALPRMVARRFSTIKKRVRKAGPTPSDPDLHRVRIAAKNLRYASELSIPVIGKAAKRTAERAEDLQTVLGAYHDASASIDWLARVGASGPADASFAAGALAATHERRRDKLGRRWRAVWKRLSVPKSGRWTR